MMRQRMAQTLAGANPASSAGADGCYNCKACGQRHAADDTDAWCSAKPRRTVEVSDQPCRRCGALAGSPCISQRQQYGTHGAASVPPEYRNRRCHADRDGNRSRIASPS